LGRRNRKKKRSSSARTLDKNQGAKGKIVPLHPTDASGASGFSTPGNHANRIELVHQAIERQSYKSALDKAKQLHKQMASPESEALLIEAYLARIRGMMAKNMLIEAKALTELMTQRFPRAVDQVRDLQCTLAAKSSDMDALVAPIAELTSPKQWPQSIQDAIRCDVTDPGALAECKSLRPDHPLRVAARAVADAFTAVTTGAVTEAALALPEVSRKSPLASWKWVIRAMACMYQGQDNECLTFLDAVDPDSAAAGLVPVIRSILAGAWEANLSPTERHLVESVAGETASLRSVLSHLDEDFEQSRFTGLHQRVREVFKLCEQVRPELIERLNQHLYVKCVDSDVPVPRNGPLLPEPPRPNAYFWRLMARDAETDGEAPQACALWNQFRLNAVHEGLFSAQGQENVFLYLHMADLLRAMDADDLDEAQWEYSVDPPDFDSLYELADIELEPLDKPKDAQYFVYPGKLYERVCSIRPDADTFKRWLDYVEETGASRPKPDEVAERWARACPEDWRPWLHLAESAEARNAFTKGLKYVDKVEQLGGRDPKAKRARVRLLVAKTLRHLKQDKLHLVPNDVTELQALPSASDTDQQAFIGTLQWTHALLSDDPSGADSLQGKVVDMLGGDVPATLLLLSVVNECKSASSDLPKLRKWLSAYKKKGLISALARVCPIGRDINLVIQVPATWRDRLFKWFRKSACGLDMDQLRIVTEAVLTAGWNETAYHCTRHGLQAERIHRARFLFLRAQCLPVFAFERRQDCLDGAAHLARATRQMDLLAEIVDYRKDDPGRRYRSPFGLSDSGDLELTGGELDDIVTTEVREKKFPTYVSPALGRLGRAGECQCPKCRRQRKAAQGVGPDPQPKPKPKPKPSPPIPDPQMLLFDDLYDDADDPIADEENDVNDVDDVDIEDDIYVPGIPRDVQNVMREFDARNNGESFTEADFNRILDESPEMGEKLYSTLLENIMNGGLSPDMLGENFPGPMPRPPLPRRRNRKKRKR
jgi:hypothetical protein